jgi:hypothetical protein
VILDASNAISKFLNIWLYQTICSQMIYRLRNFIYHFLS